MIGGLAVAVPPHKWVGAVVQPCVHVCQVDVPIPQQKFPI